MTAGETANFKGEPLKLLCMLHALDLKIGYLGSTVRKGAKWLYAAEQDKDLELCVCPNGPHTPEEKNVAGHGKVIWTWYGQFSEIPARFLEVEHEQGSRQYSGLFASMQKAYGPSFSDSDYVTVLIYKRID